MKISFLFSLMYFCSLLHKDIDLRKNFSKIPSQCDIIKTTQNYIWYFDSKANVNNYSLNFKFLYCKYISDPTSLSSADIQDMNIFSMHKEVEQLCDSNYNIIKKDSIMQYTIQHSEFMDFDQFISQNAQQKVLMLNDDHARMETRAFFLSKLSLLRQLGYTHLAMEAFQNLNEKIPSVKLGYYFQEPIMAEIYREAKHLGFKFIQYESFNLERAKEQAINLYTILKGLNENEKVVVFAGQSSLTENLPIDEFPMFGSVLKQKYNIDPLTIDQTRGLTSPNSIDIIFQFEKNKRVDGIVGCNQRITDKFHFGPVDYFYFHPEYQYNFGRPEWLSCGGIRKHFKYKCKNEKAVLIQVYYEYELTDKKNIDYVTPADMIYKLDENKNANFYLRPNYKYVVVYRDENNTIICKDFIQF